MDFVCFVLFCVLCLCLCLCFDVFWVIRAYSSGIKPGLTIFKAKIHSLFFLVRPYIIHEIISSNVKKVGYILNNVYYFYLLFLSTYNRLDLKYLPKVSTIQKHLNLHLPWQQRTKIGVIYCFLLFEMFLYLLILRLDLSFTTFIFKSQMIFLKKYLILIELKRLFLYIKVYFLKIFEGIFPRQMKIYKKNTKANKTKER